MSKETLSISVDSAAIERARKYSSQHGTSISDIVSDFFAKLPLPDGEGCNDLPPITRTLYGIASADSDEDEYREHLWQKYGS